MAHLNLIIQRSNFSQWSRKGKVKGRKILPYFTLGLIYQRAIYHRPYQGNMRTTFWGLFGKSTKLVADKGFRTKAITELLEQNKKLSTLPLKRNTTLIREKNLRKLGPVKLKISNY